MGEGETSRYLDNVADNVPRANGYGSENSLRRVASATTSPPARNYARLFIVRERTIDVSLARNVALTAVDNVIGICAPGECCRHRRRPIDRDSLCAVVAVFHVPTRTVNKSSLREGGGAHLRFYISFFSCSFSPPLPLITLLLQRFLNVTYFKRTHRKEFRELPYHSTIVK